MKSVNLNAYPRSQRKRTGVKKVRQKGRVPAVIYGRQNPPQSLEIGIKDIENLILHSGSEGLLIDLAVETDQRPKRLALVQAVQHHPLSGKVLHIDLHEVAEDEKVTITLPVETVGESVGVKVGGGTLEHVLFKVKVRALPKDLPEVLEVDVAELQVGQSIHIGELKPPPGVEILGDKKIVVISVAGPKTVDETVEAAAPESIEPEMIKEKKLEPAPDKKAEKKK
jgi:large subunit ribosomal protein L25